SITRNVVPKPRIFRFPPEGSQSHGTKIVVVGHPPHRKGTPFTLNEIETFLARRTFVGFTRDRQPRPRVFLTVTGVEKELDFGQLEAGFQRRAELVSRQLPPSRRPVVQLTEARTFA